MVDTPKGETVVPEAPKNDTSTQGTPPEPQTVKAADNELETLRKEKEQADMRANQLANEKKALEEKEAKRQAEELKENNKFKELFEQEEAKRIALEKEAEDRAKEDARSQAESEVLAEFPESVQELAKDTELSLTEVSDEARTAFKEKLEKLQNKLSGEVTPNNPSPPGTPQRPTGQQLREKIATNEGFAEEIAKLPGVAKVMEQMKSR